MPILSKYFYLRPDVVQISKELLGKVLFTNINGIITAGIITETEAYAGIVDKASHAYNNRRTNRTEIMFAKGGVSYVYLCYGIHHLFNIVTNIKDIPHAVLIRAIQPVQGLDEILSRRKLTKPTAKMTSGPGTVSQALGITTAFSGLSLQGNIIWVEEKGISVIENQIITGPRIGVDYAAEDALLPYRFRLSQ
ncbi:MAG: DNA-3-methyladenine glycosylase [Bacteroidetes bacterium]|nr:DNA-3-methyladenine glycosylase [Bacteroidota bacterium]HET6243919.1 DNA-3-methyladenine glycosylase [Bacteroidia bacterium]